MKYPTTDEEIAVFWFRRDLRLFDNHGLYEALKSGYKVLPIFIFDRNILDELDDPTDRRINFLYREIENIKKKLHKRNTDLAVFHDYPENVFKELFENFKITRIYTNHDYEQYARNRDENIAKIAREKGAGFHSYKDQCIFERKEVLTKADKVYTVFTPYSKTWLTKAEEGEIPHYGSEEILNECLNTKSLKMPKMQEMGFEPVNYDFPEKEVSYETLKDYEKNRNYPGINGTSRVSVHLRFGTVSIRQLVKNVWAISKPYLNELVWRDFYMQILANFPHVEKESFRREYNQIPWVNDEEKFEAWCKGETGYPIVDAGMRELNETGYMHNRVRMITASFLTKHLLTDWRWGEAYFGKKLLDYELSSNNGGWQWAAGSGTDAAPYFRIFNPDAQTKKFDDGMKYIKKWVPEYQELYYTKPIVEHKSARDRALSTYKEALEKAK